MEIKGKVHCFFEQSGTFKNEFIKLGIPAEDYDIQNNFGETDHVEDLFSAIEDAYDGKHSLFDQIKGGADGDLILAFFPCIYFSQQNMNHFDGSCVNLRKMKRMEIMDYILDRSKKRQLFYEIALKMFAICESRGVRLVVENPYSPLHYLNYNFPFKPAVIDKNRQLRGDYFRKPTQYWFVNCQPTEGFTEQTPKEVKVVKQLSGHTGSLCDEDRSMISPDYARNFICDFILGRKQPDICPTLF